MSGFSGFSSDGLALLTALGEADRAFFQSHKKRITDEVMGPAKAFVDAMTGALRERLSADIIGQAKVNGSISPLNNDLRFNPDRAPYKDHLLLKWWEGANKKTAPTLWVRLAEQEVGFAVGIAMAAPGPWRQHVAGPEGESLQAALKTLSRGRKLDIAGAELKRVPSPHAAEHPRADLLRHKRMFQARWSEPAPARVHGAAFVPWAAQRLEACAAVHRWLCDNL